MTRDEFITRLRRGLAGVDPARIEEVLNDYESHFDEGLAAGRTEQEVAAALGDPARLAREVRAEAGFRRWESEGSPSSLAGAVLALLGLATVDVMFLFPFLCMLVAIFVGCAFASFGMCVGGIVVTILALVPGAPIAAMAGDMTTALAAGLAGIGLIACGIGLGAMVWWAMDIGVRLLVRYARLHFQLIDAVTA